MGAESTTLLILCESIVGYASFFWGEIRLAGVGLRFWVFFGMMGGV